MKIMVKGIKILDIRSSLYNHYNMMCDDKL